jgi:uncharacterized protein YbbC (DUF1343 family)/CubicO group peptidase (beta-lactamase class C family)
MHMGPLTIPHVAFTWYVLIGAMVTFALGSLFSLVFQRQTQRIAIALLCGAAMLSAASEPWALVAQAPKITGPAITPDFSAVSNLLNTAILAHQLPGAVVVIGHDDKVVFEHAYGLRKLAGEPGLDGKPSPAEPMTEDTIFDMASLTKCLATATAVMQLYEAGKIASFDDPVEKYLPAFNPQHDPQRARVTLRMLLTHTSGEAPDVYLKDSWGLAEPDRAEGLRRALTTPLKTVPGTRSEYSDINFILLGDLVETLSGQPEDVYATEHIFKPLGMTETRYLPVAKACGPHRVLGAAIVWATAPAGRSAFACPLGDWSPSLLSHIAPTTHDDEGSAETNPHFNMLTRGTVHDPTTRRMGGVAGHAGVFSTAHDMSLFAQALLDKLTKNAGPFPLQQATLQLMTTPEQPGHNAGQLAVSNAATHAGAVPTIPGLAAAYPAVKDQNLRGFGWDIDTGYSKPRGAIFPIGSFGHTGFTGTSLWMDPNSDTYVILLANAIHPRGNPPISNLRGQVATAAAKALGLTASQDALGQLDADPNPAVQTTLTGIDSLEQTHFAALKELRRIGLFTNQSGLDARGRRTIDVLIADHQPLAMLFSPEHGLTSTLDTAQIANGTDRLTQLPVISLYGAHDAERRPKHAEIADLDAIVIDLQDAGVHFWTYEAAVGYFLEAGATEVTVYHHPLQIILLDRPNPIGGVATQGPVSESDLTSYVNYMPLPVRHGLTLGELAKYIVATKHLATHLTVIPMQHWQRAEYFADTGLPWVNPSPNLRSPEAAVLYPALGLIETTNLSVGRGTGHPFSFFGAPFLDAPSVAAALTARHLSGVTFTPATEPIVEDANRYPFHGQTIPAVRLTVTDRNLFDSPETGIEILGVLHRLYPTQFKLDKAQTLLCNRATLDALLRGDDPRSISLTWKPALDRFKAETKPYLLYK